MSEPLKETIAGKEYTLPELNTYDKHEFRGLYRRSERAKLLARLADAGATKEEIVNSLTDFDANLPRNWLEYINEMDGLYAALNLAIRKGLVAAGKPRPEAEAAAAAAVQALDWPEFKLQNIVSALMDFKYGTPAPAAPAPDTRTYGDSGDAPEGGGNPPALPQTAYGEPDGAAA